MMFGSLIALLLVMLAIDMAPAASPYFWPSNFIPALMLSMGCYAILLGFIFLKRRSQILLKRELLVHGLFLAFTILFLYFIGFQRFVIRAFPLFGHTVTAFLTLLLYFTGIAIHKGWNRAFFYLPFALPFLFYLLGIELLYPRFGNHAVVGVTIAFALFFLLLFPLLLRKIWNCVPLSPSPMKEQLDAFCRIQRFTHGGLQVWRGLKGASTAAIIGIMPRYRCVLFTENLLKIFPHDEIEAILAHEIGHCRYKHLILYPCILLGTLPLYFFLYAFFESFPAIVLFFVEGLLFALYFRFVFGFFSRHFERQADLFTLTAGLSPHALISALRRLAEVHDIPLEKSNWHHGSIHERVCVLEQALENPNYPNVHRRLLRIVLLAYFLYLAITSFLLL